MKKFSKIVLTLLVSFAIAQPLAAKKKNVKKKPVFVAAQLTDIHLRKQMDSVERFQKFVKQMRKDNPEISVIFNTGDVLDGHKGLWKFWIDSVKNTMKGLKVYSLLGNHDGEADVKKVEEVCKILNMPNRYYSFTHKGYCFIMLDGNTIRRDEEQFRWLELELKKVPKKINIVVMSHQPIKHNKKITDLLSKYPNVKLSLAGHTHSHADSVIGGVTYINGGATSGFWWEQPANKKPEGRHKAHPSGYGLIKFYADGTFDYKYILHNF